MADETISIGARLREIAAERPDRPAVTDQHRTVTWAELDRRTDRIARGLEAAGVKFGDLVTVGLANGVDFIEACYGLWKVGATPQPISHRLPAAEAAAVMELAETPILIAGEAFHRKSRATTCRLCWRWPKKTLRWRTERRRSGKRPRRAGRPAGPS